MSFLVQRYNDWSADARRLERHVSLGRMFLEVPKPGAFTDFFPCPFPCFWYLRSIHAFITRILRNVYSKPAPGPIPLRCRRLRSLTGGQRRVRGVKSVQSDIRCTCLDQLSRR